MASALASAFLAAKLRDPEKSKALYAIAEERGGAVLVGRLRTRTVAAVATMLASAPDARFDDPAIIATIVLGALVGPVQILIEGDAPAEFGTRLEREIVSLLTAYLSRSRLACVRKSTQITGSNRPFNSSSL